MNASATRKFRNPSDRGSSTAKDSASVVVAVVRMFTKARGIRNGESGEKTKKREVSKKETVYINGDKRVRQRFTDEFNRQTRVRVGEGSGDRAS